MIKQSHLARNNVRGMHAKVNHKLNAYACKERTRTNVLPLGHFVDSSAVMHMQIAIHLLKWERIM
jgi:hypothetical protein